MIEVSTITRIEPRFGKTKSGTERERGEVEKSVVFCESKTIVNKEFRFVVHEVFHLGRFITSNYLKQICLFAVRQGVSLNLVQLDEVKLPFRPKGDVIPSHIKIIQAVVMDVEFPHIQVPKDESRGSGKSGRGFGFIEFEEHVHALACLRYLNNNPAFSWAAVNVESVVELYKLCGETIDDDPHHLAKLVRE